MENSGSPDSRRRVLLVTFPAQGHINPALQFAKRLTRRRVDVTFATSLYAYRRMGQTPPLPHLSFASFSDGYDSGFKPELHDVTHYLSELERRGSEAVTDIITASATQGQPFTCVVYTILLPWVSTAVRSLHLPAVLLWIQPATVFALYHYYFTGHQEAIHRVILNDDGPSTTTIQLPGLPPLAARELPSFFRPTDIHDYALPMFRKQFELLEQEPEPKVLVNTFDELERDAMQVMGRYNLRAVGPLIPSAFLDGEDPSDVCFGGDMFKCGGEDGEYIDWLNSKSEGSVVYVSFGSISTLSKQQKEEIARGLLSSGRPFLWVMRDDDDVEEDRSLREELEGQGKIVQWCSQLEVLSNSATGCFLTHCGWNSCLESLVCGVPMVAFPQWSDQGTNAKIVEDLMKTGVRLEVAIGAVVKREEVRRCLELVMAADSKKGEEIRRNAKEWKELAKKANTDSGSSDHNLKAFVDQICPS